MTFPSTTSREKWISGRWSPRGLEVKRRRSFYFCEKCVISSSWGLFFEGVFSKHGGLLRIMAGCEKSNMEHESESDSTGPFSIFIIIV